MRILNSIFLFKGWFIFKKLFIFHAKYYNENIIKLIYIDQVNILE